MKLWWKSKTVVREAQSTGLARKVERGAQKKEITNQFIITEGKKSRKKEGNL